MSHHFCHQSAKPKRHLITTVPQGHLWPAHHRVETCALSGDAARRRDDRATGAGDRDPPADWWLVGPSGRYNASIYVLKYMCLGLGLNICLNDLKWYKDQIWVTFGDIWRLRMRVRHVRNMETGECFAKIIPERPKISGRVSQRITNHLTIVIWCYMYNKHP